MSLHRKTARLKGYDYSSPGYYHVTICSQDRECLFGAVIDGKMVLNNAGQMIEACWTDLPKHFMDCSLDEYKIMPNHVHGIIIIRRGTACRAPTREQFGKPVPGSLPTIVRSFKSASTRQINQFQNTPERSLWQRNYYEHIIRTEKDLNHIREYIINNSLR